MIEDKTMLSKPIVRQAWTEISEQNHLLNDDFFKEFKFAVDKLIKMLDLTIVKSSKNKNYFHTVVERISYDIPYRSLVNGVIFGEKTHGNILNAFCRITITHTGPRMPNKFVTINGSWHTDNWKLTYE